MYELPSTLHSSSLVWCTENGDEAITWQAKLSHTVNQDKLNEAIESGDVDLVDDICSDFIVRCVSQGHWSVLEMANLCVAVKTTRDVSAQILRHKSFSFQEFSQRYAKVKEPIQMPVLREKDGRLRNPSVRSSNPHALAEMDNSLTHSQEAYEILVNEHNIHPESARKVLPLQTTTTVMMNGTIRSWFHYLRSRTSEHSQFEHQLVAKSVLVWMSIKFPICYDAFLKWNDMETLKERMWVQYQETGYPMYTGQVSSPLETSLG